MSGDVSGRFEAVEARISALGTTLKSVLATLVLRGILTRADVTRLLEETQATLDNDDPHPASRSELRAIDEDMTTYLRAAIGPAPDPDADDH